MLLALGLGGTAMPASATTSLWRNVTGDWFTAVNWLSNGVPLTNYGVTMSSDGPGTSIAKILTSDTVVDNISVQKYTAIQISNGYALTVTQPGFLIGGTIIIGSAQSNTPIDAGYVNTPRLDMWTNEPAALGAAKAIDAVIATNPTSTLATNFVSLTTEREVANAVESTLPGASGNVAQLTNIATNAVTDVVSARQNAQQGISSGDAFMTDRHIWFKPFGGWTQQDNRQGVTGYDIDSYGLALGVDGDISSSWNVGVAFAYINSDVESNLTAGSHQIDMDSYLAKVYATKMFDEVTALNLQAGVAYRITTVTVASSPVISLLLITIAGTHN